MSHSKFNFSFDRILLFREHLRNYSTFFTKPVIGITCIFNFIEDFIEFNFLLLIYAVICTDNLVLNRPKPDKTITTYFLLLSPIDLKYGRMVEVTKINTTQ